MPPRARLRTGAVVPRTTSKERREEGRGLECDSDQPRNERWREIGRTMNPEGRNANKRGREENQTEIPWETTKGPDQPAQDDSGGSSALSEISREPDESW
ncbi:hypothetical protein NDU88_003092 [Pleurodeles waltl]|uniref:Uncharacterized protein n=1 Tax=Pleurodeles waltl TaxID=8319 RepID=A0AAV7Q804_PLEWA|nr:hypothetical protein NDU88_003092 [Pleurodeles waltl]